MAFNPTMTMQQGPGLVGPPQQGNFPMLQQHLNPYGQPSAYGDQPLIKPPYFNWRKKRLNLVAIFISLFVPWLLFCFIFYLNSFKWFYKYPFVCFVITFLALCFVIFLGVKAIQAVRASTEDRETRRNTGYEPTWLVFLFLTSLLAWCLGCYFGYHNFYNRMDAFYGLNNLGSYSGVNPGTHHGQQLMDAGKVLFEPGTHIDFSKSMSFRNNELYCIAPIVSPNYTLAGAPGSYDFWAVGTDCCCGDTVRTASFQCGEYNNPSAAAGLRLMRDEQRPFFRLAVEQAVGAYGIRANHPLFFHWVQDPMISGEAYNWEGHRQFLIGAYAHFGLQSILVCIAAVIFSGIDDK